MITSLEEIKAIAGARELEIEGWEKETPFVCKLKRISLLELASKGKIPNGLMSTVMALFEGDKAKTDKIDVKDFAQVMDLFCEMSLVEPNYKEVKEYLTDNQKTQIFNYAQKGLKALEKFRI